MLDCAALGMASSSGVVSDAGHVGSRGPMSYLKTLLVQRHDDEVRYIAARMWIKALCFLVTLAFFVGYGFGQQSKAAGYRALIGEMSAACQADFEKVAWRGIER